MNHLVQFTYVTSSRQPSRTELVPWGHRAFDLCPFLNRKYFFEQESAISNLRLCFCDDTLQVWDSELA